MKAVNNNKVLGLEQLNQKMDVLIHHVTKNEASNKVLQEQIKTINFSRANDLEERMKEFIPNLDKQLSQYIDYIGRRSKEITMVGKAIIKVGELIPQGGVFKRQIIFDDASEKRFFRLLRNTSLVVLILFSIGVFGIKYNKERPYKKAFEHVYKTNSKKHQEYFQKQ